MKKIKLPEERFNQEVYNKRLGIKKATITGGYEAPVITITDEFGECWIAEVNSNFYKEWKPIKGGNN